MLPGIRAARPHVPVDLRITDVLARHLWLATFVPLLCLYAWTLRTDGQTMSPDPTAVVPSALALAQHGTPRLPHDLWPWYNPWAAAGPHGTVVSNRPPGLVLLAAPLYRLVGGDVFTVYPSSVLAAVVTAAAMAGLAVLLTRLVSHRAAWLAALVAGAATTTWSVSGTALWPHGPDQFLLVAAMSAMAGTRYARAGFAFAATMLIRPTLGIGAAVMGLVEAWRSRSVRPALVIGVLTALGAAGYWWYARAFWSGTSGNDLSTAVGVAAHGYQHNVLDLRGAALREYGVKLLGAVFSPGKGIVIGSPFLLLLVPGLAAGWRAAPAWVRAAAVSGLLYLLVQLKSEIFTGGQHFWSYRYPLEALTLAAPLLTLAWREWTARHRLALAGFDALAIFAVFRQAIGAIWFRQSPGDHPWTWDDMHAALHAGGLPAVTTLMAGNAVAITWFALRASGRTHVFHVARADHQLLAAHA